MYKYYSVPVVDGGIVDRKAYPFIPESIQNEAGSRLIKIDADYPPCAEWTEIGEEEYFAFKQENFPDPPDPAPTGQSLEEKVTQLQNDNLTLMDALATTFEELLVLEGKVELLGGAT